MCLRPKSTQNHWFRQFGYIWKSGLSMLYKLYLLIQTVMGQSNISYFKLRNVSYNKTRASSLFFEYVIISNFWSSVFFCPPAPLPHICFRNLYPLSQYYPCSFMDGFIFHLLCLHVTHFWASVKERFQCWPLFDNLLEKMSVPCYLRRSLMPVDEDSLFEFKVTQLNNIKHLILLKFHTLIEW